MNATFLAGSLLVGAILTWAPQASVAQTKARRRPAELASESRSALQTLCATTPLAKALGPTAAAVLVFPQVTKAGLGIGGQCDEGTLLKKGTAAAYYKTTGASFGLQAGGQRTAMRCFS